MWALIVKAAIWALGLLFPAKDERDIERQAGEEMGIAKVREADATGELHDIAKADAARNAVTDDSGSVFDDPDNAGPARPRR